MAIDKMSLQRNLLKFDYREIFEVGVFTTN